MLAVLKSLNRDEEGATMVEYGLLVALVAVAAVAAVQALGSNLGTLFSSVAGSL
jgi:pilus assembly protein Flp/PilA